MPSLLYAQIGCATAIVSSRLPWNALWLLAVATLSSAMAVAAPALVDNKVLANQTDGRDWPAYGRDFSETRHSPLKQVSASNAQRLGLAWSLDLSDMPSTATAPIVVNGVMYLAPGHAVVHAVDAKSGKLLWRYDPEVGKVAGQKLRGGWGSRGLAYWKDKVYVGTTDGRLIALNARTGKLVWSVMTVGKDDARYITGAPRVFNGKVVIGHGGADYGATRGYVTAYDTETGKQLWRFFTVPGDPAKGFENKAMEMAAKTWTGEWWKHGGGGTVWNAMTYDPEFNRIYLGTGNGAPWNQKIRSPGGGDNLFLCAVVALDADTGEYVWHYQTNPGETWDYNSAMDMVLTTLTIDGQSRKVLMHAPKNGFFYVIDRANGKPISAEKIGKVTWAERIDLATGRPVENPEARYPNGEVLIWPGTGGVHNWPPMSFNPASGLVYIPIQDLPGYYNDKGIDTKNWRHKPGIVEPQSGINFHNDPIPPVPDSSALLAWDPIKQQQAWKVPLPGLFAAGTLSTAGNLVFQGRADGRFVAYAADTGKEVWSVQTSTGIVAPPISFQVGKTQYVSIITGHTGGVALWNAGRYGWQARVHSKRLYTFALDARTPLPVSEPPAAAVPLDDPQFQIDAAKVQHGREIFGNCMVCHGPGAIAGGAGPDLRASPLPLDAKAFDAVVRGGLLQSRGMPRFEELTDADLDAMRHYLRQRARETLAPTKAASGTVSAVPAAPAVPPSK